MNIKPYYLAYFKTNRRLMEYGASRMIIEHSVLNRSSMAVPKYVQETSEN